ncbi:ATP-dependent DNA ligase [Bradyrhizobium sp. GM6.1]
MLNAFFSEALRARKGKLPVVGFKEPVWSRCALSRKVGGQRTLLYMGKVVTGWDRTTSGTMRKALNTVVSPRNRLSKQLKKPKATWVEPVFTAEVEYRDITSEGLLRASVLKGFSKS